MVSSPQYHLLAVVSRREQIAPQQSTSIVVATLKEVLFDVLQEEELCGLTYLIDSNDAIARSSPALLALVRPEKIVPAVSQLWTLWQQADLTQISPNLTLILQKPDQLREASSPKVYATLSKLINGHNTLRDLADLTRQDLLKLTLSLKSYFHFGYISLEMPTLLQDPLLPEGISPFRAEPTQAPLKPLIACVDDSPDIGRRMQEIIEGAGYRFIWIQDAIQAVPTLIEKKPDLIFLDITMPVVNGYEVCAQIRRVAIFKETPIIFSTSNDGLIDRVRAKVVGSNDFLSKPPDASKVLGTIQKYLTANASGAG